MWAGLPRRGVLLPEARFWCSPLQPMSDGGRTDPERVSPETKKSTRSTSADCAIGGERTDRGKVLPPGQIVVYGAVAQTDPSLHMPLRSHD
jgi:hypothetical protein